MPTGGRPTPLLLRQGREGMRHRRCSPLVAQRPPSLLLPHGREVAHRHGCSSRMEVRLRTATAAPPRMEARLREEFQGHDTLEPTPLPALSL
jgi:hypothetical protein